MWVFPKKITIKLVLNVNHQGWATKKFFYPKSPKMIIKLLLNKEMNDGGNCWLDRIFLKLWLCRLILCSVHSMKYVWNVCFLLKYGSWKLKSWNINHKLLIRTMAMERCEMHSHTFDVHFPEKVQWLTLISRRLQPTAPQPKTKMWCI